jgi:hypothetical protein
MLFTALYNLKVWFRCAISAWRILGPSFLHKTINSKRYMGLSLLPFLDQLTDKKSQEHLVQDNAMAHRAKNSTGVLDKVECVIHGGMWPMQSLNLNAYDFYLWGMLQHKVHANNPHTLEELQ